MVGVLDMGLHFPMMKLSRLAIAMMAVLACGINGSALPKQSKRPCELTKYDIEAIEKANRKRARKVKK